MPHLEKEAKAGLFSRSPFKKPFISLVKYSFFTAGLVAIGALTLRGLGAMYNWEAKSMANPA